MFLNMVGCIERCKPNMDMESADGTFSSLLCLEMDNFHFCNSFNFDNTNCSGTPYDPVSVLAS